MPHTSASARTGSAIIRSVGFSVSDPSNLPRLLFSVASGKVALAQSSEYKIPIVDQKGKLQTQLERNVPRPTFSKQESQVLKERIVEQSVKKNWPKRVQSELLARVPKGKCFLDKIFLTENYLAPLTNLCSV